MPVPIPADAFAGSGRKGKSKHCVWLRPIVFLVAPIAALLALAALVG